MSTPELSVGGEGACRTGLVASVVGDGFAVCRSHAKGLISVVPGINRQGRRRRGGLERSAERYLQPSRGNIITACRDALSLR